MRAATGITAHPHAPVADADHPDDHVVDDDPCGASILDDDTRHHDQHGTVHVNLDVCVVDGSAVDIRAVQRRLR